MMDELEDSRAEVIIDISNAILKAAGTALIPHGNDPQAKAILAAAYTMAIKRSEAAAPRLGAVVSEMLKAR